MEVHDIQPAPFESPDSSLPQQDRPSARYVNGHGKRLYDADLHRPAKLAAGVRFGHYVVSYGERPNDLGSVSSCAFKSLASTAP